MMNMKGERVKLQARKSGTINGIMSHCLVVHNPNQIEKLIFPENKASRK